MKTILKFITFAFLIGLVSCKKDTKEPEPEPEPVATTGSLKIEFEHLVDTIPFAFNQNYRNPKLDTFKVTILRYYISNIVITKNDNSTFVEPNSYHLVDAANISSTILTIANVPITSYKSVSFMLGVDSIKNVSGAQAGALAPSDMFWNWSTGYIMFKLEGTSPKSGSSSKALIYHLGGFGGVNKTQRNFNFSFGSTTANVSKTTSPIIHLAVNINEFFKSPTLIDFTTQYFQMNAGPAAKIYADNLEDMISFKHIHN